MWTRPVWRSFTGWFPPRWPNFSLYVLPPRARPRIWWPRQMPRRGTFPARSLAVRTVVRRRSGGAGAPGRLGVENLGRMRVEGHLDDVAVLLRLPDDVRLDAAVDDDEPAPAAAAGRDGPGAGDLADEIPRLVREGHALDLAEHRLRVLALHRERRAHRAARARFRREHAGVHTLEAGDGAALQPVRQAVSRARVGGRQAGLADDVPSDLDLGRLERLRVHPIVPHEGVGHHEDLAAVRGVREGLAVARHVRVEDELPVHGLRRPEDLPLGDRAVLDDQGTPHRVRPLREIPRR